MNQQQLQTARAALWHQTAPLLTADEATSWLQDLGFCLFLPRHAQLPAPAPSFVEAIHGAANAAPPAAAIAHASEFAARLVDEDRVVPLNLLGTHSEQPDFLITPEVLPWVAAIRGERQWKEPPGSRTSPLVVRTWETLDREGESSAVDLREVLGRELTEAAVLRALIELWTTVRAMPVYKPGEPTRWTLLKHRFPAQLTTAANTGQGIALSALLSIYLRSTVAATADEAEIFLSPLTARSRIREVIHGMTALRQFGSMSVGSKTLLFVEGSLPENLPVEEANAAPAGATPGTTAPAERSQRAPRPTLRKEFAERGRPSRPHGEIRRGPRPSFRKRPGGRSPAKPWQKRPAFRGPDRPAREERPSAASRPGLRGEKRPSPGFRPANRDEKRSGAKPWQRRPAFRGPDRPAREERPSAASGSGPGGEKRSSPGFRTAIRDENRPGVKPWQRRPAFNQDRPTEEKPRSSAKFRPAPPGEKRPATGLRSEAQGKKPPEARPWQRRPASGDRREDPRKFDRKAGERSPRSESQPPKFGQNSGPKSGFPRPGPQGFGRKKPGSKPFAGPRPKFVPRREGAPAGAQGPGRGRPPGFGKPRRQGDSGRPFARGKDLKGPGRKNFSKASPGKRNPRKNRSQEENPE